MSALPMPTVSAVDSTAPEATVNFSTARFAHHQLETWLCSPAAKQLPADQVEEETNCRGREITRLLLEAHFRERGTGDVGPAVRRVSPTATAPTAATPAAAGGVSPTPLLTDKRRHRRMLKTIVGRITIERTAYGAPGQDSMHPLDAQAELPDGSFSYPLQQRLVRAAVQGPYDEAVANVELATGLVVAKGSCEQLVQAAASDFEAFYQQRTAPPPTHTGSILAAGVDGKGVPMIKPEETLRKLRLGKGEKRNKKRMATVATVRTHEPWVRTPEDVVASLFDDVPAPRPLRIRRQEHKRVWASLTRSKDAVIAEVAAEMKHCDPEGTKVHVAVTDGERALQQRVEPAIRAVLGSVILILDFMHVLEKIWKAAHCFYAEGSDEAEQWVRVQALRLLQGQVAVVLAELRARGQAKGLKKTQRETLAKIGAYLERNQERMHYDAYLRQGLPIASGSVEGACRHLVKDRLERAGMRWSLAGAEALIQMRAVYLSDDFTEYWEYHQQQDQLRAYPPGSWEVVGN
jgi:hypothetical protein